MSAKEREINESERDRKKGKERDFIQAAVAHYKGTGVDGRS